MMLPSEQERITSCLYKNLVIIFRIANNFILLALWLTVLAAISVSLFPAQQIQFKNLIIITN
ncbi:hypothetical protein HZS_267 [Henneguya salminicola]|nr:hypothetical protein HZS_267 [Henneguya salminicola]